MKIRLKPTKEQESLFIKSCGAKRFAYNWGLERFIEIKKNGETYNKYKLKKEGSLCDVVPTITDVYEISRPNEMTGESLIIKNE